MNRQQKEYRLFKNIQSFAFSITLKKKLPRKFEAVFKNYYKHLIYLMRA